MSQLLKGRQMQQPSRRVRTRVICILAALAGVAPAAAAFPIRALAAPRGPAVALAAARFPAAGTGRPAPSTDWPAYLDGPSHSSDNAADTAITPANVSKLVRKWHFVGDPATSQGQPPPGFLASPTVADGAVYIGSSTGWFYKLSESTGAVLAKVFIGYQPRKTCDAGGFVATATVATDPSDGQQTVYAAGVNGYLYALRATNLSLKWKSVIALPSAVTSDYFQWSSPTVVNGQIYIGVASNCDQPLVPGGLIGYHQSTGAEFARFYSLPTGMLGGSVWSSAGTDSSGDVYITTGNGEPGQKVPYYSDSIVKLDPATLQPAGAFTVPTAQMVGDGDFGGSPTIFGPYVGACNKNGIYYVLSRSTMTVAWQARIGAVAANPSECSAAAIYDGTSLYLAGPATTIRGVSYRGSIERRNPATGRLAWQTGLPNGVIGGPTMNGAGVIAVGTYDFTKHPNAIYLVSAATGRILRTLVSGSADFAQSVFANGWLFTANGAGLDAWGM